MIWNDSDSITQIVQQLWTGSEVELGPLPFDLLKEPNILQTAYWDYRERWIIVAFKPYKEGRLVLGLYPKVCHSHAFVDAYKYLSPTGPVEMFPGGVAAIGVELLNEIWGVWYIQCLYNQKLTPKLKRALVSKYGGAREHLLEYILGLWKDSNATKLSYVWDPEEEAGKKNPEIFQRIFEKEGYTVDQESKSGSLVLVVTKR